MAYGGRAGVELRLLFPSPLCTDHRLQCLSQKQARAADYSPEGAGGVFELLPIGKGMEKKEEQAYLPLPSPR